MDEWIEIEGRNREECIERACIALNTTKRYLKIEVVENTNGRKIRALKLEEAAPEPAPESAPESENRPVSARTDSSPRPPMARPRRERLPQAYADEDAEIVSDEEPEAAANEVVARPVRERENLEPLDPEAGQKAKAALEKICSYIDPEAKVELVEQGEEVRLEIIGTEAGLFIGKFGQTLESLQMLVARMTKLDRMTGKHLFLDAERYRERRRESLEDLAQSLASRAVRDGRPVGARPMGAMDRRAIHVALAEHPDVTTKSVGQGMDRKVLVVPRNGGGRRGGREGGQEGGRSEAGASRGPARRNGRNGRPSGRDRHAAPSAAPGGEDRLPKRRSGPPARQHDSFDVPVAPEFGLNSEDPEAPLMQDGAVVEDPNRNLTDQIDDGAEPNSEE